MALDLPETSTEVEERSKTDVERQLPGSNPFLKNSVIGALVVSFANRVFDFYLQLKQAVIQALPDTATGGFLDRWGAIFLAISRFSAVKSSGSLIAGGNSGGVIPTGTFYTTTDGKIYISTANATISTKNNSVDLTFSSPLVTAVTSVDHNLANNIVVSISGAADNDYNGSFSVTVSDEFTLPGVPSTRIFKYEIAGVGEAPDTGFAAYSSVPVPVTAEVPGASENLTTNTPLTLQSPLVDVNETANVNLGGITNGADQESDTALRFRLLDKIQNPVANFNVAAIRAKAFEVPGVTRVFVDSSNDPLSKLTPPAVSLDSTALPTPPGLIAELTYVNPHGYTDFTLVTVSGSDQAGYNGTFNAIVIDANRIGYIPTGTPAAPTGMIVVTAVVALGSLRIFFMRDNDANPIPSGSSITDVTNKLLEILPANTSPNNMDVLAPIGVEQDFVFNVLDPNTTTMKSAITASLAQFFSEETLVGVNVDEDAYRSAIFNTVDTTTGDRVLTFGLSTPSENIDITVEANQIIILGDVTFV